MRNTFIDNISLEETKPLFFNRIEKYNKKETIPTEKPGEKVTCSARILSLAEFRMA